MAAKPPSLLPQDYQASAQQGLVSDQTSLSPTRQFQVVPTDQFFNDINTRLRAAQSDSLAAIKAAATAGSIYGVERLPWVFATFEDVQNQAPSADSFAGITESKNSIVWVTNPKSVSWSISQRGTETKNKSGTVLHIWRDRSRGTDYDDPKIKIDFQSGNIMPQSTNAADPANPPLPNNIAGGLNNFYQYLRLVDQPKIAKNGQANVIHILYRSHIFPSIVLTGFFDPQVVVQFTDDSANPFQINGWSASFTIYSTTPKLKDFNALLQRFQAEGLTKFKTSG